MYTFVTVFLKTFLYHTGFVYIRYISLDVFFPYVFALFTFVFFKSERFADCFKYRSCLHPFLCVCIVYIRYTF